MTGRTRKAFERVVDAICWQRALPFLGAGVSREAPYEVPAETAAQSPALDLEERLANYLWERAKSSRATRKALTGALGRGFRSSKALKQVGLPWLAEQVVQLEGGEHQRLCEILEIRRFLDLQPTPAHRYLAFLAREGLISEVITTNYDRCLEKALEESGPESASSEGQGNCVHVVTDFRDYSERFKNGRPLLTVYKINGSVEKLEGDPESARRIVLTELALQAWHGEEWAARLFADRVGQKAMILTGFSGEEAQIRFAVAALCNEFGKVQDRVAPEEAAGQPTAPFVHAFRHLNRFQQQILHVWFAARAKEDRRNLTAEKRLEFIQANAFTGEHRRFFREEDSGLTADRFWEAVFMSIWRRILEKELTSGVTGGFLTGVGLAAAEIASGICQELFDDGAGRCDHSTWLAVGRSPAGVDRPWSLVRCFDALQGRDDIARGAYVALREEPLQLSFLLLFLAWSQQSNSSTDRLEANATLGLRLPRADAGSALETWLASSRFEAGANGGTGTETTQLALIQIALFMKGSLYSPLPDAKAEPIRETCHSSDGRVFKRYGVRVDVGLLLRLAASELKGQSGWGAFCAVLNRLVDVSWSWTQDHRPSFRDRTDSVTEC